MLGLGGCGYWLTLAPNPYQNLRIATEAELAPRTAAVIRAIEVYGAKITDVPVTELKGYDARGLALLQETDNPPVREIEKTTGHLFSLHHTSGICKCFGWRYRNNNGVLIHS